MEIETKSQKISLFESVALLVGTVVGAGFLGIPYVVSKIGFPLGLLLIFGIGSLMLVQYLLVAETTLRTADQHQLAGYTEKYLGKKWRSAIYTLVIMESYGGLLAFIVGAGQVLAAIFGGSPWGFSFAYFALMAVIVFVGLKLVEKLDLFLTLAMFAVIVAIGFMSWSQVSIDNFSALRDGSVMQAYGIILFSFLGAGAVPQMRRVLRGRERLLPRAVVLGALVPIVVYTLFTAVVLGVTGKNTTPVATIALGQALGPVMMIIGNFLAAITMTTSFLGVSMALKETFLWDLKKSKTEAWLYTITVPIILFAFGLHNFIKILMVVGALFGGIQGIIMVATSLRAEKLGDRQPEFRVPGKKFFAFVLTAVFIIGIVYTLKSFL